MTDLVASLSTGKGTWGHVSRIIEEGKFDNVFLVANEFGSQKFEVKGNISMVVIDPEKPIADLINDIKEKLKDRIKGTEVALNLASGPGKEHMAIISALLKLGLGIRLVALTADGLKEI